MCVEWSPSFLCSITDYQYSRASYKVPVVQCVLCLVQLSHPHVPTTLLVKVLYLHTVQYSVEPPNKGHFGSRAFVLFSEVLDPLVGGFIAISKTYRMYGVYISFKKLRNLLKSKI